MKNFIILLMMCMILTVVQAQDTVYQVNQEVDVKLICINEGYCSASSYCTNSIIAPNSTAIVNGQNFTNQNSYHNYTLTHDTIGVYQVGGFCIDGDYSKEVDYKYYVTESGELLSTGQSVIYISMLLLSIILFSFSFYWMIVIPFGNFFDYETGKLTGTNDWKYLKMFLIPVNYVMLMWIFGLCRSIAANYLLLPGPALFFQWAFWVMLSFAFPLVILALWFLFLTIINDRKINDALERGMPY